MKKKAEKRDLDFLELKEPSDDLKYMLWQAELNNRLASFWKYIGK